MNILLSDTRLVKLKQHAIALTYLAASQTFVHFKFPPFSSGILRNTIATIICILCYAIIFLHDDSSVNVPKKPMAITIYMQWGVFGLMHIIYGYQWYTNSYQAPHSWYLIWYFQSASALAIIYYSLWRKRVSL